MDLPKLRFSLEFFTDSGDEAVSRRASRTESIVNCYKYGEGAHIWMRVRSNTKA